MKKETKIRNSFQKKQTTARVNTKNDNCRSIIDCNEKASELNGLMN